MLLMAVDYDMVHTRLEGVWDRKDLGNLAWLGSGFGLRVCMGFVLQARHSFLPFASSEVLGGFFFKRGLGEDSG